MKLEVFSYNMMLISKNLLSISYPICDMCLVLLVFLYSWSFSFVIYVFNFVILYICSSFCPFWSGIMLMQLLSLKNGCRVFMPLLLDQGSGENQTSWKQSQWVNKGTAIALCRFNLYLYYCMFQPVHDIFSFCWGKVAHLPPPPLPLSPAKKKKKERKWNKSE